VLWRLIIMIGPGSKKYTHTSGSINVKKW